MAAPACALDLEDGEEFLPKDIFPDEDDLLLWRGATVGDDQLSVKEPHDANAGFDVELDLNELAAKLATLGLGLGVLPPGSECRVPFSQPSFLASPQQPVFTRCGADSRGYDQRLPVLPSTGWAFGARTAEAIMLRNRQQRAAALLAARASALGLPVVNLEGGGTGGGSVAVTVAAGFPLPTRVSTGGRVLPAVAQGRNGNATASLCSGAPFAAPQHVRRHQPHAFPVSVARRRCGGTGVFLPRTSSSAATSGAAAVMKNNAVLHQQMLRYQHHHHQGPSALSKNQMTARNGAPYPAATIATPAIDWSSY